MRYRDAFPKVEPGFEQLARVLRRERPDRVPAIELFSDHEFIAAVLGYSWDTVEPDKNLADWQRYWLWRIEYQRIALPDFLTPRDGHGGAEPRRAPLAHADRRDDHDARPVRRVRLARRAVHERAAGLHRRERPARHGDHPDVVRRARMGNVADGL
jgi:hypothetical protein